MPATVVRTIAALAALAAVLTAPGLGLDLDRDLSVWVLGRESPRRLTVSCPAGSGPGRCLMLGPGGLELESERVGFIAESGDEFALEPNNGPALVRLSWALVAPEDADGLVRVSTRDGSIRSYRGAMRITARDGVLHAVNVIDVETYLESVTGCEINARQLEAMKAQAVLARTLVAWTEPRYGELADLDDLTTSQAYKGVECESHMSRTAVRLTGGEVLAYQGEPIQPFYHSTSGGVTTTAQAVWGAAPLPYIRSVDDGDAGAESPHFRWSVNLGADELRRLGARAGIHLSALAVPRRDPQGRAARVVLIGGEDLLEMSGYDFYRLAGHALGWHVVKSTWFDIEPGPGGIRLTGRGLGHGVGMCQWGAMGHAARGWDYIRILRRYFPGTELMQLSFSGNPEF